MITHFYYVISKAHNLDPIRVFYCTYIVRFFADKPVHDDVKQKWWYTASLGRAEVKVPNMWFITLEFNRALSLR